MIAFELYSFGAHLAHSLESAPMSSPSPEDHDDHPPIGRRGGTTTTTPDRVRKTVWIDRDVEAHLRRLAYESGRAEAEFVREALRRFCGFE